MLQLGKRPARHDPRTFTYAKYRTGLATAPSNAHWGHRLPFTMLANDKYGDCAEAAYAHMVQIWGDRAGNPFVPDDADTLAAYSGITGFNPNDPATDQGTVLLDAVNYWKSTGMQGHRVSAFAAVNPLDVEQVKESVAWFGGLYIGLQLPASAQGQVRTTTWTVTNGPDAAPGSWGGHAVPICGYDPERLWCVTWGFIQAMTWDFLATYCDEAFVLLANEWINASGLAPSNLAWGQLLADIANL